MASGIRDSPANGGKAARVAQAVDSPGIPSPVPAVVVDGSAGAAVRPMVAEGADRAMHQVANFNPVCAKGTA